MELDKKLLDTFFVKDIFQKNSILTKEGDVERYVFYILKGVIRLYVTDDQANEFTFDFAFPNDFICSYQSFIQQIPSNISMQAITIVECYKIEHSLLKQIMNEKPDLSILYIEIMENLFVRKVQREILLLKNNPFERYRILINKESHLLQKVPLQYIASYIGITPQALSRIRKRIS